MIPTYELKERLKQYFDDEAFLSILDTSEAFDTDFSQVVDAFELLLKDFQDIYKTMQSSDDEDNFDAVDSFGFEYEDD